MKNKIFLYYKILTLNFRFSFVTFTDTFYDELFLDILYVFAQRKLTLMIILLLHNQIIEGHIIQWTMAKRKRTKGPNNIRHNTTQKTKDWTMGAPLEHDDIEMTHVRYSSVSCKELKQKTKSQYRNKILYTKWYRKNKDAHM
jgi:hypothetical protein